jgi:hypothetical protein
MDFLKRARWKAHLRKGQIPSTAGIWDCFNDLDYGAYWMRIPVLTGI